MNTVTDVVIAGPIARDRITIDELRRIVDASGATGIDYDIVITSRNDRDYDSWIEWSVVKRIEQSGVELDLVRRLTT